jgi:hypothetical protein
VEHAIVDTVFNVHKEQSITKLMGTVEEIKDLRRNSRSPVSPRNQRNSDIFGFETNNNTKRQVIFVLLSLIYSLFYLNRLNVYVLSAIEQLPLQDLLLIWKNV